MLKNLKISAIRIILAMFAAGFAASCETPESERIPSVFTITPSALTPGALEESVLVNVECDLHWTVQLENDSWGSISVQSVQEGIGGQFLLKTGANLAEWKRENTLIVKAGKSEKRIPVTQKGLDTFFSPRSLDIMGTNPYTVTFTSPSIWTASITEGEDWLTLGTSGGGAGNAQLVVTALEDNKNVGDRKGNVQVSIGSYLLDIPVSQQQLDFIQGEEASLSFLFDTPGFSINTRYNVPYQISTSVSWIEHSTTKAPAYEGVEEFRLTPNTLPDARTGVISFTSEGHPDASYEVTVVQEGKDPILSIISPGAYGVGKDIVKGADGWNQSSYLTKADGSIRYRLLKESGLEVLTLTGLSASLERGDACTLHLTLANPASASEADYPVTLIYQQNGMSWFKGTDGTYFIIKEN